MKTIQAKRALRAALCAGLMACALPTAAWAGEPPTESQAVGEQQDASLFVEVLDRVLTDDSSTYCSMSIQVLGERVEISEGDSVSLELVEDDPFFNDVLWQANFEVTPEEVEEQLVQRTFDCSTSYGEDQEPRFEIFARAEVVKAECGLFCRYDRPTTASISVERDDEDDAFEDNDELLQAEPLSQYTLENLISRDEDWFEFTAAGAQDLTVGVFEHEYNINMDVKLFDEEGQLAIDISQEAEVGLNSTILLERRIEAGTYFLRVAPLDPENLGFYWMEVLVDDPASDCDPGMVETRSCGQCGEQTRTCQGDGTWGELTACQDEGVCAPGSERTTDCGMCGQALETCNDQCQWDGGGACEDEGECERGAVETLDCGPEQVQVRTCDDSCVWGDFGQCRGQECEDGDVQGCYDGPAGTSGVGICQEGRSVCENGLWQACEGQVAPIDEICDDGQDNDCNGKTDAEDNACDTPDPDPEPEPECQRDADCPAARPICDPLQGVCIQGADPEPEPGCRTDADCPNPATPICNARTGQCVADPNAPDNNPQDDEPAPDPNADAGAGATAEGCAQTPGSSPGSAGWTLLFMLGLWLVRRKR